MSSMILNRYAEPLAPTNGHIYNIAHTASATRYEVPAEWYDSLVTIVSDTSALYVAFGGGGVKVNGTLASQVVTASSETIAADQSAGFVIPAGQIVTFKLNKKHTHFSFVSSAASGYFSMFKSTGFQTEANGEGLPQGLDMPQLWLDASDYSSLTLSGTDVASWRNKGLLGGSFDESSTRPVWTDATSSAGTRATIAFTAGNTDKLVCTDAAPVGMFDGTDSFTLVMAVSRTTTGAGHTLFSVGTNGSNDGRWDFTADTNDDPIMTRVTSGGASTTSSYASTLNGYYLFTWTFNGTTPAYWQNRTSQTLTGTAAGDIGTASKIAVGCRGYNTSTYNQYATAQIAEILAYSRVLDAAEIVRLHNWAKRRYGV